MWNSSGTLWDLHFRSSLKWLNTLNPTDTFWGDWKRRNVKWRTERKGRKSDKTGRKAVVHCSDGFSPADWKVVLQSCVFWSSIFNLLVPPRALCRAVIASVVAASEVSCVTDGVVEYRLGGPRAISSWWTVGSSSSRWRGLSRTLVRLQGLFNWLWRYAAHCIGYCTVLRELVHILLLTCRRWQNGWIPWWLYFKNNRAGISTYYILNML